MVVQMVLLAPDVTPVAVTSIVVSSGSIGIPDSTPSEFSERPLGNLPV